MKAIVDPAPIRRVWNQRMEPVKLTDDIEWIAELNTYVVPIDEVKITCVLTQLLTLFIIHSFII
jgi:hypothetical protein